MYVEMLSQEGCFRLNKLYIHGTTISVRSVETITPPIIDTAIGIRLSAPGPSASAAGIAPAIVATEVIRIGRKRTGHASNKASRTETFFASFGSSRLVVGSGE
jgi:hypothetical protein